MWRGAAPLALLAALALGLQGQPGVTILEPVEEQQVEGPDVRVRLEVRGVELAAERSRAGAYLLLRLDDAPPVKSYAGEFTFQGVEPGPHLLRAELRRNDGTPFDPPARDQVRFTVRRPGT